MLFEGKISLFSLPCAQNPPGFDIALSRLAHPPLPHKLYGGITWQQTMWNHSTHCQRQPYQQSAPPGFRVRKNEFSTYSGSSVKDHHRWSKTGFLPPVTLKENERKGGSLLRRWGGQDISQSATEWRQDDSMFSFLFGCTESGCKAKCLSFSTGV